MKNEILTIGVLAVLGTIALVMFKNGAIDPNNPKIVLKKIASKYGDKIADWVERIYRLETGNFTSKQYQGTYSAGMEAHSSSYPYGWSTPAVLWAAEPRYKPVKVLSFVENQTGKLKPFVAFRDLEGGMMSLAHYLAKYQNPGRWYSTDKLAQDRYISMLANIDTQWT